MPANVKYQNNANLFHLYLINYIIKLLNTSPLLTTLASTSWVTHILFVATTMNWNYSVLCLWQLLQIVSTCLLFVATPMNSLQCTLFVTTTTNWKYMCTVCHYYEFTTVYSVCGHYYKLGKHMYCLWPLTNSLQ